MSENTQTLTFLDQLRSQTRNAHTRLESLPVSASITSNNISILDYAHYLQLMHAVILETENKIFPVLSGVITDIDERRKLQWIENDLQQIGSGPKSFGTVFKTELSLPFALGVMYTVEGSTMGGRYILKNIESVLGLNENQGAKYFAGYGHATGKFWKNFLNFLTDYESQTGNTNEIIAGAQYAFEAIHNHFLSADEN